MYHVNVRDLPDGSTTMNNVGLVSLLKRTASAEVLAKVEKLPDVSRDSIIPVSPQSESEAALEVDGSVSVPVMPAASGAHVRTLKEDVGAAYDAAVAANAPKDSVRILRHLVERADAGTLASCGGKISVVLVGRAAGISQYKMTGGRIGQLTLEPWLSRFKPVENVLVASTPQDPDASWIARVRALLRDKAESGEPLMSENFRGTRASMRAISDETNIPFGKLRTYPLVRREVRDAIVGGAVTLGPKYKPTGPLVSKERINELTAVVMSFDVDGGKLPENPKRKGAPDFDRIAELTGKEGLNGKESYTYTQMVMEVVRRRGTELPGISASMDTFAALMTFGVDAIKVDQKRRGLVSWANGVANAKSALERFCNKLELTLECEVDDLFAERFDDNVEKAAGGLTEGAAGNFRRAMASWRKLRVQRFDIPELSAHFGPALGHLILARGYNFPTVSREADIPVATLRQVISEKIGVTQSMLPAFARVEALLRVPAGTLLAKITHVSHRVDRIQGATAEYVAVSSRVRALLPYEAAFWKPDRLTEAVAKVEPLLRAGTTFGDLIQVTREVENRLAPFRPSAELERQLESYTRYKTVPVTYPLLRRARWISDNTRDKGIEQLRMWMRFACTEAGDSAWCGLGLPLEAQTLAWAAVPTIVLAYTGQRAKRFADMDWKGEARGTFYTESEAGFLEHMMSLTNPVTGWLVQHPELAKALVPFPHQLPSQFDDLLQLYTVDGGAPLLTEADVTRARGDWKQFVAESHTHYVQARKRIIEIAAISRNPYESVSGLMLAEEPVAEYMALLFASERHWACPRSSIKSWRLDVRDAAITRLAPITGFRPFNLMGLTFTGDTRGQIRKIDGTWDIEVPYKLFKNRKSCRLFGTHTAPKNFRMQLRNEFGLYEVLDTWFFECLPALRAKDAGVPAFANRNGDPMSVSGYGDMMKAFSAKYIAWNPVLQTGFSRCHFDESLPGPPPACE